jgi:hypothetical protein
MAKNSGAYRGGAASGVDYMSSMLNPAADNLSQFTATGGEAAFRQNDVEGGGFRPQTQPYTPAETPGWLRSLQDALAPAPDSVAAGLGIGAPGTTNQNETSAARDARMGKLGDLASKAVEAVPGVALAKDVYRMATSDEDPTNKDYATTAINAVGLVNPALGAVGKLGMKGYEAFTAGSGVSDFGVPTGVSSRVASVFGGDDKLGAFLSMNNNFAGVDARPTPYASQFMRDVEAAQANNASDAAAQAQAAQAQAAQGWSPGDPEGEMGPPSPGGGGYASAAQGGYGTGGYSGTGGTGDADGGLKTSYGTRRADGTQAHTDGVVGLSTPGYADGGFMSSPPSNLTQMGFADGGSIGLGAPGSSNAPDGMQAQAARMARDPQLRQRLQQMMAPAMQSGQLTPEELVTIGRIATAAMHNPDLYPQLRQFVAQQGLNPLPAAYSPQVVMTLLVASQIMAPTPAGQIPPTDQAQMQNPTGAANGGMLQGPGTGRSDSIGTVNESTGKPVKVANGEYVIPEHVVKAKGRDFFDKMLRQYAQLTPSEK